MLGSILTIDRRDFAELRQDLQSALGNWQLSAMLAVQDIRYRYRRSAIGPFWLTLSLAINIGALGAVWSILFDLTLTEFLPFLTIGFLLWSLITALVIEGCTIFIDSSTYIRQTKQPLLLFPLWMLFRNLLIFSHHIVVYLLILLVVDIPINVNTLLVFVNFPLAVMSFLWMSLLFGVLATRYRDITQMVSSMMQVLFYVTPIIWTRALLKGNDWIADVNPFAHVIDLVRLPLMGEAPPPMAYGYCVVFGAVGWSTAIFLFARFRRRIPYWL